MSKWVVEAISLAYEAAGQPSPWAVRSHSTRSMADSKALISGVSLQDVCDAAGWSSPHTFVRFYSLDLDSTPGSQKMEELVYAGTKLSHSFAASPQISIKKRQAPQPPKPAGPARPPHPPVRALQPLPQRQGPHPTPSARVSTTVVFRSRLVPRCVEYLRELGVKPGPINAMVITKPVANRSAQGGVRSGLYRGMVGPLPDSCMFRVEEAWAEYSPEDKPLVTTMNMSPDKPLVESAFGLVQEGSVLSYQQPVLTSRYITLHDAPSTPPLPLEGYYLAPSKCMFVCTEEELLHLQSLNTPLDTAQKIEEATREQSSCPDWHQLRRSRVTASRFREICHVRGLSSAESLAERIIRGTRQTAEMRRGAEMESEVTVEYSKLKNVNYSPCGLIIHPNAPWLVCLGVEHAQAALEGAVCANCEIMPLRTLRSRRAMFNESGQPRDPRGSGPASVEAARRLHSWGSQRDLVDNAETASALSQHSEASSRSSAQGAEARAAASSAPVAGPMLELSGSEELESMSIDAGECENQISIHSPAFEELLEVVTRAVDKLKIDWPSEVQEATVKSKLDERFLQPRSQPLRRSLPFFPDLHTEVSRSWNKPFSSRISGPNVHLYSNILGAREEGYGMMPRVEESFASHLSPDAASSLRAPTLPTKPCRTTSALVGKAYMAAGRAGSCLHTMGLLQAYQADLLKEADDSGEIAFDDIREMRRVVDLSLRATKETARAIGRSMAALVATERHLWLNLSGIGDKDRACLLDAPVSPSGLFGDGVNQVVERFQEAKRQSAAFKELIPRRRSRSRGSAARGQSHEAAASSSHLLRQKESVASRAPPQGAWRQKQHPQSRSSKPKTDLRTVIQAKKASAKRP
ncbi:unnamed protein product [Leuciscus chuanchicus]